MSTNKYVDQICVVLILAILAGVLALFALTGGSVSQGGVEKAYESGLFDTTKVHTLDITMEDWEGFLETCENEAYAMCSVTIDGETVREIGIRAKGNSSLTQVKQSGNNRYSFKLEFDHYQDGVNYQGLDKLSLNNIIQDNTYLKDYLCYQLMGEFG
ncbi:MAG: CotH kinase family protein, partial [Evtepia sp.]|nr:CotH kinase family protein [Evtepia sp.]